MNRFEFAMANLWDIEGVFGYVLSFLGVEGYVGEISKTWETCVVSYDRIVIPTQRKMKWLKEFVVWLRGRFGRGQMITNELKCVKLQGEIRGWEWTFLRKFVSLSILDLSWSGITDEDVSHIAPLTSLKRLSLAGGYVTNNGINMLSGLICLERLNLASCWNVTDVGIGMLKVMIKYLNLPLYFQILKKHT